jgi:hypothetical protein
MGAEEARNLPWSRLSILVQGLAGFRNRVTGMWTSYSLSIRLVKVL